MRVLFDTNVVVDVLSLRLPWHAASAAALDRVARGEAEGFIAGHAVATIDYVLRKSVDQRGRRALLTTLMEQLSVAPVTDSAIRKALGSPIPDFEDAVTAEVAEEAGADAIVTRNVKDFSLSRISALTPEDFLKM